MEQTEHKKTNRYIIIGFIAMFTIPVFVAWAAYFNGWFATTDTNNKGEWVNPMQAFEVYKPVYADKSPLKLVSGQKWKLILPAQVTECQSDQDDESCLLNLYVIGQTHLALGKEAKRVERILYNGSAPYDEQSLLDLKERFIDLRVVNSPASVTEVLSPQYIYIADPIGNIILRYPLVEIKEDAFLKGKDILLDIKKLLKLSRLG